MIAVRMEDGDLPHRRWIGTWVAFMAEVNDEPEVCKGDSFKVQPIPPLSELGSICLWG